MSNKILPFAKPLTQKQLRERFRQLEILVRHWETQLERVKGTFAESSTRDKLHAVQNEMSTIGAQII